jgi:hypothetical protein
MNILRLLFREVNYEKTYCLVYGFLFPLRMCKHHLNQIQSTRAKLSLDGKVVGETPHFYTDKAVAGTMKTVTLKKEGYKDFSDTIKREELSVPALIGGIFLIVPLAWILEYPTQYNFEMEKLDERSL